MTKHESTKSVFPRGRRQRLTLMVAAFLLAASLIVGCSSSRTTLAYPPTGTPTPRPDALYLLNYRYVPGQPPDAGSRSSARRILDPAQIQHFYNIVNDLSPFPYQTTTTATCYESNLNTYMLFIRQGHPTLEVNLWDECQYLYATLIGFNSGNPPTLAVNGAITSDQRMATTGLVQEVQQAFQSGVSTPVQDLPYQPPPRK